MGQTYRELKFRAWNIPNKLMYYDIQKGVMTEKNGILQIGTSFGAICNDAGSKVMQFTGLKDKNNKEIYEGDIIEYTQHRAYNLERFKAKVVYDNERACFGYLKENPVMPNFINSFTETDELEDDFLFYCEVIGNIYENSDLLS